VTWEQARDLWLGTLAIREVPPGSAGRQALEPLWRAAGLAPEEVELLAAACAEPEDLARRERVVRTTRRLLAARGFPVDVLTTPAAPMHGL
jgi:hypothetical protein